MRLAWIATTIEAFARPTAFARRLARSRTAAAKAKGSFWRSGLADTVELRGGGAPSSQNEFREAGRARRRQGLRELCARASVASFLANGNAENRRALVAHVSDGGRSTRRWRRGD